MCMYHPHEETGLPSVNLWCYWQSLFGVYDYDGKLVYIGKCSGMTDEERERWTKYLAERKNSTPLQVIEIKSNDLVGSGKFRTPRHPQYLRVRTDKYPADCKIDQFLVEE